MSNACKYTPQGGEINIILYGTKHKVYVDIQDTGIGIPHKEQKLLFSTVYRAENARKSQEEGSGFGLLQVHRLVKLLQGKISFRSKENMGTTFTLAFKQAVGVAVESGMTGKDFAKVSGQHFPDVQTHGRGRIAMLVKPY